MRTYDVDTNATDALGHNVRNLYSEISSPAMKDFTKWTPESIQSAISAMPDEVKVLGSEALSKPETLKSAINVQDFQKLTAEEIKYLDAVAKTTTVESALAKGMLKASEPNVKIDDINEAFAKGSQDYQSKMKTQTTDKDLPRTTIMLKDQEGKVQAINADQIDSLQITGEQKEFIKTSWQQGTFMAGWVATAMTPGTQIKMMDSGMNPKHETYNIMIDLSQSGAVKVRSLDETYMQDVQNPTKTPELHSTGTLEVDISTLTGDKFSPGFGTAKPQITATITEHREEFGYQHQGAKTSGTLDPKKLKLDFLEGKINSIQTNHARADLDKESLQKTFEQDPQLLNDMTTRMIQQNNHTNLKTLTEVVGYQSMTNAVGHKKMTEVYCAIEKDPQKQKEFANNQIAAMSSLSRGVLDGPEKERIKNNLINIMAPLCKNDKELNNLQQNAGKLVRECSVQAGVNMSWGESFNRFKDKVSDFVSSAFQGESKLQKILNAHPEIVQTLKKSMSVANDKNRQNAVGTMPKTQQKSPAR